MNRLKQAYLAVKQCSGRAMAKVGLVGGSLMVAAGSVMAQQAADPGLDAINALKSSATAYIGAGFAVLTIVVAGFWGMKMYKRVSGKT